VAAWSALAVVRGGMRATEAVAIVASVGLKVMSTNSIVASDAAARHAAGVTAGVAMATPVGDGVVATGVGA
jgi:hypothetical protein